MTITLAVAGKGGTGKTTLAALLIRYLTETQNGPMLAIDADPSSNLNLLLGLPLEQTIGDIREELLNQVQGNTAMDGTIPGGMSKQAYLEYQTQMALVEGEQVDLLAMGRPEGPGCYCAVNQMLRTILDQLTKNYAYVVMDNEAGMEHISRRTTRDVDVLLLVSDPTQRGLLAAQHMAEMIPQLEIDVGHTYLVINRLRGELPAPLATAIERSGLPLIAALQEEPAIAPLEFAGQPLTQLADETPLYQSIKTLAQQIGVGKE